MTITSVFELATDEKVILNAREFVSLTVVMFAISLVHGHAGDLPAQQPTDSIGGSITIDAIRWTNKYEK